MRKLTILIIFLAIMIFYCGCKTTGGGLTQKNSDAVIGSIAKISSPDVVLVEGVGLVGGLNGKGSSECPTDIRKYLTQYILSQMPGNESMDVGSLIDSMDTAVVVIDGVLPVKDSSHSYFDLRVTAYRGTQTVSLENGWLYPSEVKIRGTFGINTAILADVLGPVFTDQGVEGVSPSFKLSSERGQDARDTASIDKRTGYILGGGKIMAHYPISLVLNKADFELTNNIRNRFNMRFGRNTAKAVQAGMIEVTPPTKYKEHRGKFIELIKTMYVYDVPENDQTRIDTHIRQLVEQPDSNDGEFALEAMGNQCLGQLFTVLKSPDEHVRLRAARCMLNLRSDEGLRVLKEIILNERSPYRIEALKAVTESGPGEDASYLALELLKDENFNIRLAAYEQLSRLNDNSIVVRLVASAFFVEKLAQVDKKDIYVTRSGQPKVVLFGSPISCEKGFVIKSANGEVTIDAPADQDYVIVYRKFPNRPDLTGQIKCTYELGNIIQALCDEPPEKGQETRGGLGVSYSDLIALLKQMCDRSAIDAEFHAGPMPKIDLNVKK